MLRQVDASYESIFDSPAHAIVIPVNCKGILDAGLALSAKTIYPLIEARYKRACKNKILAVGWPYMVEDPTLPYRIVLFPTKDHWQNSSEYKWIAHGLRALGGILAHNPVRHIALPALGCGLDGLEYRYVFQLIHAFARLNPEVQVDVYVATTTPEWSKDHYGHTCELTHPRSPQN